MIRAAPVPSDRMQARVVCRSGADGAGAAEAAALVAEQLGYRVIDEEILVRAAVIVRGAAESGSDEPI